jgi:competence protein ComEC
VPRPAWLALGVVLAAAAASYLSPALSPSLALLPAAAIAGALMCGVVAAAIGGKRLPAPGSLAIAGVGAALVTVRLAAGLVLSPPAGPTSLPGGTGPWQSRVESVRVSKGDQLATIVLDGSGIRCAARLPGFPELAAGDTIAWAGRVEALGTGSYAAYLADQGIAATCEGSRVEVLARDSSPLGRLEGLRQAAGDALQRVLPEPAGGLAAAILIGLRDRVDRDVAADFTTAGVSHIVAISGWNIAIVAACVAAILRGRVGRRRRSAVTLLAIVAYTLFAGASASVVRAAFMAATALLALETGRGSRVAIGLAWAAVVMLLLDPATAGDAGFQLSAMATAGLVLWATPLDEWMETRAPFLPGVIRETLAVSLAAQAATLPIVLATFGRLALIAPVANLVAVPLVPPTMAAGLVALIAGWLGAMGFPAPLASLLAMPADLALGGLILVVRCAAAVPGASQTLPFPANVVGAAVAGAGAIALHRRLSRRGLTAAGAAAPPVHRRPAHARAGLLRRAWPAFVAVALAAIVAGSVVAAAPDGSVHVLVLDVGQGDAILVEGNRGSRLLVDGGPDPAALLAELDRHVPAWDRRVDAVVLTHPHGDHVGGLAELVRRYRVGRAFESGWPSDDPADLGWHESLRAAGVATTRLRTGDRFTLDDVVFDVLWPDDGTVRSPAMDPAATDNRRTNDSSIVLLGSWESRRFLLTGDAEDDVDPILVGRGLPNVDLLKVAHHGSATATSAALLAALRPGVAAISVGADNTYGHPNAGTLQRLGAAGASISRTDRDGTIEVVLARSAVTVRRERAGAAAGTAGPRLEAGAATGITRPAATTTARAATGAARPATMAWSDAKPLARTRPFNAFGRPVAAHVVRAATLLCPAVDSAA